MASHIRDEVIESLQFASMMQRQLEDLSALRNKDEMKADELKKKAEDDQLLRDKC